MIAQKKKLFRPDPTARRFGLPPRIDGGAVRRRELRVLALAIALAQVRRVFGTMPGSKEIVEECARFAAQPEVDGAPVAARVEPGSEQGYSKLSPTRSIASSVRSRTSRRRRAQRSPTTPRNSSLQDEAKRIQRAHATSK